MRDTPLKLYRKSNVILLEEIQNDIYFDFQDILIQESCLVIAQSVVGQLSILLHQDFQLKFFIHFGSQWTNFSQHQCLNDILYVNL